MTQHNYDKSLALSSFYYGTFVVPLLVLYSHAVVIKLDYYNLHFNSEENVMFIQCISLLLLF